jgi:hypothetical protein
MPCHAARGLVWRSPRMRKALPSPLSPTDRRPRQQASVPEMCSPPSMTSRYACRTRWSPPSRVVSAARSRRSTTAADARNGDRLRFARLRATRSLACSTTDRSRSATTGFERSCRFPIAVMELDGFRAALAALKRHPARGGSAVNAALVNAQHPGRATHRELAGLDHCWTRHVSMVKSRGNCGSGEAVPALSDAVLGFLATA